MIGWKSPGRTRDLMYGTIQPRIVLCFLVPARRDDALSGKEFGDLRVLWGGFSLSPG